MSSLFHVVDDVFVILRTKTGVFRQAKVFIRGEGVYAGHGTGFVKLMAHGTSCPTISWSDLTPDPRIKPARVGSLSFDAHALPAPPETKLIEARANAQPRTAEPRKAEAGSPSPKPKLEMAS